MIILVFKCTTQLKRKLLRDPDSEAHFEKVLTRNGTAVEFQGPPFDAKEFTKTVKEKHYWYLLDSSGNSELLMSYILNFAGSIADAAKTKYVECIFAVS